MIIKNKNDFKSLYVAHKDMKEFTIGLKTVYQASNLAEAGLAMDQFKQRWGKKYPLVIKSWRANRHYLTRFFDYSANLRRIMYTTNTIEGFNRQIRRVTKRKGAFPTEMSLMKLLFMAKAEITKEWTQKPPFWG